MDERWFVIEEIGGKVGVRRCQHLGPIMSTVMADMLTSRKLILAHTIRYGAGRGVVKIPIRKDGKGDG